VKSLSRKLAKLVQQDSSNLAFKSLVDVSKTYLDKKEETNVIFEGELLSDQSVTELINKLQSLQVNSEEDSADINVLTYFTCPKVLTRIRNEVKNYTKVHFSTLCFNDSLLQYADTLNPNGSLARISQS